MILRKSLARGALPYLVLLLLEGSLSLLQSSLKLLLLDLEPPPLLVQLVDGAAAIAKLVEQILDLVSQVLEVVDINKKQNQTPVFRPS